MGGGKEGERKGGRGRGSDGGRREEEEGKREVGKEGGNEWKAESGPNPLFGSSEIYVAFFFPNTSTSLECQAENETKQNLAMQRLGNVTF